MRQFGGRVYQFFQSRKSAVVLLFLLSGISILGTVLNFEKAGSQTLSLDPSTWLSYFETGVFYHSPVFILAIVLLFTNLIVCTYDRLRSNWGKLTKVSCEIEDSYLLSLPLKEEEKEGVPEILLTNGYKVYNKEGIFCGEKGRIYLWGTYITHISIILTILTGAVSALFSYVGTVGIFERQQANTFYNWTKKEYQALPFTIRIEKMDIKYYTPEIELEIRDGKETKKYSIKKGGEIFYQKDKFVFFDFLPDCMVMNNEVYSVSEALNAPAVLFKIYQDENFISNYWIFAEDTGYQNKIELPYSVKILSSQYLVKSSQSLLNIIEDGEIKLKEYIRPNRSIDYKGLRIYFWGFNQDEYRNYFTGLQISYDPCLWFTWIALGGVLCGLCITFFVSYDRVWIKFSSGQILIGGSTTGDKEEFAEKMRGLINEISETPPSPLFVKEGEKIREEEKEKSRRE